MTFGVCFYKVENTALPPSLEGVVFCGNAPVWTARRSGAVLGMHNTKATLAEQLEQEQAWVWGSPWWTKTMLYQHPDLAEGSSSSPPVWQEF